MLTLPVYTAKIIILVAIIALRKYSAFISDIFIFENEFISLNMAYEIELLKKSKQSRFIAVSLRQIQ